MTISNPSWYLALVASLCVGLIIARSWHIHAAVWAGLIVTELLPVAMVAFIIFVAMRLKEIAGK